MAFGRWLLLALFLHLLWTPALSSIVSKSSLSQCTAYGNSELRNNVGAVCSKKLVVAMAITANEVYSSTILVKVLCLMCELKFALFCFRELHRKLKRRLLKLLTHQGKTLKTLSCNTLSGLPLENHQF